MPKTLPAAQPPIIVLPDGDDFDTNNNFDNSAEEPPTLHWIWIAVAISAAICFFALGVISHPQANKSGWASVANAGSTPSTKPLVVHIAGQVNKPGVYEFAVDARVRDAVQKAGGPAKSADLNSINLAAYLEDGQKIEVQSKPITSNIITTASVSEEVSAPQAEYSQAETGTQSLTALPDFSTSAPEKPQTVKREKRDKITNAKPTKTKVLPDVPRANTANGEESQNADPAYLAKHPLNLNSASAEQLELLPGIGPAMAAKIVAARKAKGNFKSVEELDEIPGIGEKKMEKLRPLVVTS